MNTYQPGTIEERLERNRDSSAGANGCWPWLGYRNSTGYGRISYRGHRSYSVTRLALELFGVEVPEGALVLHSCDNPPCVNPAHLRVGTDSDNRRDMFARDRQPAHLRPWTTCRRGHDMTGTNVMPSHRGRACRTCHNDARRRRLSAQPNAVPRGTSPV